MDHRDLSRGCHSNAPGEFGHSYKQEGTLQYNRITAKRDMMGGIPCIRGLRIPVATVVGMIATGMSEQEILDAYPDIEHDDIRESLLYAAETVRERRIPL